MQRSEKRLEEGKSLLDNGYPEGTCNRAYYAVFEATLAAIKALDLSPGKTHQGTRKVFYEHVVKPGRMDRRTAAKLGRTEQKRNVADYTGTSVSHQTAEEALQDARDFVSAVRSEFLPDLDADRPKPKRLRKSSGTRPK